MAAAAAAAATQKLLLPLDCLHHLSLLLTESPFLLPSHLSLVLFIIPQWKSAGEGVWGVRFSSVQAPVVQRNGGNDAGYQQIIPGTEPPNRDIQCIIVQWGVPPIAPHYF